LFGLEFAELKAVVTPFVTGGTDTEADEDMTENEETETEKEDDTTNKGGDTIGASWRASLAHRACPVTGLDDEDHREFEVPGSADDNVTLAELKFHRNKFLDTVSAASCSSHAAVSRTRTVSTEALQGTPKPKKRRLRLKTETA
jgi:hypothetical protein